MLLVWGCKGWVERRAAWHLQVVGAGELLEAGAALATPEEDSDAQAGQAHTQTTPAWKGEARMFALRY